MPIGRNCVAHYRELSRYCVFSHDEMVCNMAAKAESMDMDMAAIVQKEIIAMVQEEDELRGKIDKLVSGSNLQGLLNSSIHQLSRGVMQESQYAVSDPRDPSALAVVPPIAVTLVTHFHFLDGKHTSVWSKFIRMGDSASGRSLNVA